MAVPNVAKPGSISNKWWAASIVHKLVNCSTAVQAMKGAVAGLEHDCNVRCFQGISHPVSKFRKQQQLRSYCCCSGCCCYYFSHQAAVLQQSLCCTCGSATPQSHRQASPAKLAGKGSKPGAGPSRMHRAAVCPPCSSPTPTQQMQRERGLHTHLCYSHYGAHRAGNEAQCKNCPIGQLLCCGVACWEKLLCQSAA